MKSKKYVILGVGIIAVIGLAVGAYYVSQNSVSNEKLVTPEEAKSIMLDKVPGAKVLELSYDGDEKTPKYDGTLIKENFSYVDVLSNKVELEIADSNGTYSSILNNANPNITL